MKIVTQGKVYIFSCKFCGCEFVEGACALNKTKYDEDPVLSCPCCGCKVCGVHCDRIFGDYKNEYNDSEQDIH